MRTGSHARRAVFPVLLVVLLARSAGAQTTGELTPEQIAVGCAIPPALEVPRVGGLRVAGAQTITPRELYNAQDLLLIGGGSQAGVRLGQQFWVRRAVTFGDVSRSRPRAVHTSGWIRIVAVSETSAIASVDVACTEIARGDYLDPFTAPAPPPATDRVETGGDPDFEKPAHVLFGGEEITAVAAGGYMLIDRGTDQGVPPGTRLAIYRDTLGGGLPMLAIGEATVVQSAPSSATIRITQANGAIRSGDYAFPRKP